ncbi:MAG: hypothetical protein RIT45_856 [Pseudomonadota bacterium]
MSTGEHRLRLRHLTMADYDDVAAIMNHHYPEQGAWTRRQFAAQMRRFPEGQICIEDNGKVVAGAISVIVDYAKFGDTHNYEQITGNGFLTTHDPKGDTLYGVDVFVDPEYRGMRLGRRLYDARKELAESLNLQRIILGGRIPNYEKHAHRMSPQEYIRLVQTREVADPVLGFQLANGFHVRRVVQDYSPFDRESGGYATILEWRNIYYEEKPRLIGRSKPVLRLGVVQWQMRPLPSFAELLEQLEFFVDAVAGYNADVLLLPELVHAPLMTLTAKPSASLAMRELAAFSEPLREALLAWAVSYNLNIVLGGLPDYRDDHVVLRSLLLRRDGTFAWQERRYVTADERELWGAKGGDGLEVFDTDAGRLGILAGEDLVHPELASRLVRQGAELLLTPFWSDTRIAYLRLRHCGAARAIEGPCYTALSGCVGNLPRVETMDLQYAQSVIMTPADFAFPHDCIAAEATPNTETTLIADLDLEALKELRAQSAARPTRV